MIEENQGLRGRSPAEAGSGCQPSASAPDGSSQSGIPNAGDVLVWCIHQAEEIMAISAGCATTHGDPGGGLEWANRIASDIAINLEMLASANAAEVVQP